MALSQIGDSGKSENPSVYVGKDMGIVTEAQLESTTSDVNNARLSGKDDSRPVVYSNGNERGIAIAKSKGAVDDWDRVRPIQVGVTQADLADAASDINTIGKYQHKMVIAVGGTAGYEIRIADGALATDVWYLPTGTATGAITPS